MRVLFFLLLAANLFFLFHIKFDTNSDREVQLRPEFKPEKIKLLSAPTASLERVGQFYSDLQFAKLNISRCSWNS